ncbi:MAG: hypothetical protein PHY22_01555 [Acholeplasmataceae bacterium]|nr:hypothetical protein [Acholeplasmataceae bacterium]
MKKISKKLLLSVFSLLLMATVLGTSTYAWFTIGDTVTVSKFDMDVQGGLGLEVAYVYQDPITVEGTEISREGFVTRLTAERIYEYLSKDYEYDSPENFNEEFKMGDVTSVDGNEFSYLKYNEEGNEGAGSYELKDANRKNEGFIEFTLRFRTKEADAFLIWEDALLESQGVADWVPGFKFNAPNTDNTLIDPEGNEYTQYKYYASHAARISVTGTVEDTGTVEESKTAVYELGEKAMADGNYLNTVLSDNEPDWAHGNLQYFHTSTDYDLKYDFGTGEETYYKAAKTFTSFFEDEDEEVENGPKVVAKFVKNTDEEDDDVYYYADVTIRVYIEGFDAEAFDSILEDKLSVMLRFTFKKSSVVNGDGADEGKGD